MSPALDEGAAGGKRVTTATGSGLRPFLGVLFDGAVGMMEFRALPSKRTAFVPLGADRDVERFIARCGMDNLYVGVAARKDSTSGKLENCLTLGAVFADIDFKSTPEAEARATLDAFPLRPTMVVHSGGGLHVYFALVEPLDLTTDEPRARALLGRLAVALRGDQSAAEPARVLRVPGTLNRKPEYGAPRPVVLAVCEAARRYNPSELEEWLPPMPAADTNRSARFHAPEAPIGPGGRRPYLFRLARSLKALGLTEAAVLAAACEENASRCRPPVPDDKVARQVRSAFEQADRPGYEPSDDRGANRGRSRGWAAATSAAVLIAESDPTPDELEPRLLARGAVTEWFSPRGLGKTHVAHALAVKLARGGHRVLVLDRDNSRREVRRRLRAWGASDVTGLDVLTRDEAPALTDRRKWEDFPLGTYDAIIIDSLDAAAEGVGEQDSSKPSRAIAAILDVVRGVAGPAVLLLGNVIKSGAHGRGSGVVEDRADIVFEVRDATGCQPTGAKPWWCELPPAGRGDWAERAGRRRRRDTYRLAFIPTKYRIGEEPDPFVFELDLTAEPWTLRDVTADLEAAGQAARAAKDAERQGTREKAAAALLEEVARRTATGAPGLGKTAAETLLRAHGLTSQAARELLRQDGRWRLGPDPSDDRKVIVGPWTRESEKGAPTSRTDESSPQTRRSEGVDVGASHESWRPHSTGPISAPGAVILTHEMRAGHVPLTTDDEEETL